MNSYRDEDAALAAALGRIATDADAALSGVGASTHPTDATFAGYLSGTLAAAERESFEAHVAACARCAEDLGGIAAVESLAGRGGRAGAIDARPAELHGGERAPEPAAVRRKAARRDAGPTGSGRSGRFLRRLALAASVLLFIGVGLTAGGDALLGRLTPQASARLSQALARPVQIGDLSLGFFSGPALRVRDLRVADDARFSSDALFRVAAADLAVDTGALLRGQLRGSVRLDQPSLQLVRDARGQWNVETLGRDGDRSERSAVPRQIAPPQAAPAGSDPVVRLGSAKISAGTLAIADRGRGRERALVVEDVDVDYRSPDEGEPASVTLAGEIEGRAVFLRGEIGPFAGAAAPRYRFAEVSFARVDLASVPGAPASVNGELSFSGRIEGSGRSLEAVVATATGAGSLELCCGTLERRNLDRDLVDALVAAAPAGLTGALAALGPALAAVETDYRFLGGQVEVGTAGLGLQGFELETDLFSASTEGRVSRAGYVDVRGDVTLGRELTRALVASAPSLGALIQGDEGVALPFSLVGRWPEARLELDVAAALRTAAAVLDPRRLVLTRWLAPHAAG